MQNGREAVPFGDTPKTGSESCPDELIKYFIVFIVMANSLCLLVALTAMHHGCGNRLNGACFVMSHFVLTGLPWDVRMCANANTIPGKGLAAWINLILRCCDRSPDNFPANILQSAQERGFNIHGEVVPKLGGNHSKYSVTAGLKLRPRDGEKTLIRRPESKVAFQSMTRINLCLGSCPKS